YNGLSASKGTRHSRNAALGYGKEGIYNTLTCHQRHIRGELFPIWSAHPYGPFLHHLYLDIRPVISCKNSDGIVNGIASTRNAFYRTAQLVRHHDFLGDDGSLLNRAEAVPGSHLIPNLCAGGKLPFFITVKRAYLNP